MKHRFHRSNQRSEWDEELRTDRCCSSRKPKIRENLTRMFLNASLPITLFKQRPARNRIPSEFEAVYEVCFGQSALEDGFRLCNKFAGRLMRSVAGKTSWSAFAVSPFFVKTWQRQCATVILCLLCHFSSDSYIFLNFWSIHLNL